MKRWFFLCIAVLSTAALTGCSALGSKGTALLGSKGTTFVSGSVSYRERLALPDNALVKLQVQDTTAADAPAAVLGEQVIETKGKQVPIAFQVTYDPAKIQDGHTYSLSARIEVDGALWFINDSFTPVISGGNPTRDIALQLVSTGAPTGAKGTGSLQGTLWQWQRTQFNDGRVDQPASAGYYNLEFMPDGSISAQADCNRVAGSYTVDGSSLAIVPGATTGMQCPEGSLEQPYIAQLGQASLFFLMDGKLFIDLAMGSGTMEFAP